MKRKLTAFFLTLCLILTAFPLPAAAAEKIEIELEPGEHVWNVVPSRITVDKGTDLATIETKFEIEYEPGYKRDKYYDADDASKTAIRMLTRFHENKKLKISGKKADMQLVQLKPVTENEYVYQGGKEYLQAILIDEENKEHHLSTDKFTWELIGASGSTTLMDAGHGKYKMLTVASNEPATEIRVKVTYKEKTSIENTIQLDVKSAPVFNPNTEEIKIKDASAADPKIPLKAGKGEVIELSAYNANGSLVEKISPADLTMTIRGNTSTGTYINDVTGYLYIAGDELAENITVNMKYQTTIDKDQQFPIAAAAHELIIRPDRPTAVKGGTVQLSGLVQFTGLGGEMPLEADKMEWSVINSTESTITPAGLFTYGLNEPAGKEVEVKAKIKARPTTEKIIKIKEARSMTAIEFRPITPAEIKPGQEVALTVYAKYNYGSDEELTADKVTLQLVPAGTVEPMKARTSNDTKIDGATGKLMAAQDEFKDKLKVKAIFKADPSKTDEMELEVKRGEYTLKLKPENQALAKGSSQTFTAYVEDDVTKAKVDLKPADLNWSIVEAATDSSVVNGVFQYGANETVSPLTVKAELKYAPKTATATVMEYIGPKLVLKTDLAAPVQMKPGQTTVIKAYRKQGGIETPIRADEVTFSLVSAGTSIDTKIDESGRLSIANDEFKDMIKVKAVYKADSENMDELPISIHRTPYTLQLKPKNSTVNKGESKQFTAYVIDNATHEEVALKPTDLTWKAFVGTEAATQSAITADGVFTCGAAETASEVAIKATLKYDLSKMDDAVVKVGAGSSNPLAGYDNGSSNTGSPAAPAPQQPKKSEDNKPQDKKMDKSSEIIGQFQDIAGHWAQKAIVSAIEKGIFKGVTENSFAPERQMSRAEFITVLGRMSEQATMLREVPFKDVDANAYYAQHVAWGAALGLMKGFEDGTFRPEAKITREQAAVIFANYLKDKKLPEMAMTTFADEESISSWAKAAVKKAAALGLLKGKDGGKFAPKDLLTRAEMAQILDNLSQMLEK